MQILHTFKEHEHKRTLFKKKKLGNWDQKEFIEKKKKNKKGEKKPATMKTNPQIQQQQQKK